MNFVKLQSIDVEIDRKEFYEELTGEETFFIFKNQSAEDEFFRMLKDDMWSIVDYYMTERTPLYDFIECIEKGLPDIFYKLNEDEFRGCKMTMDMTYEDFDGDEDHDLLSSWNPNDVVSHEPDAYELLIGWFLSGGMFSANTYEVKYMFDIIEKHNLKGYANSNINLMIDTLRKSNKPNVNKVACLCLLNDYMIRNGLDPFQLQ